APDGISHVGGLDRLLWVVFAVVGWNHTKFPVSAAVIARRIEHRDVVRRLVDSAGRTGPRQSHRLARHDRIVLVRPLIEFLNLVPKLGFVGWETKLPKPRGRDPLIIQPEVVLCDLAAGVGVESRTLQLHWTASAVSTTRDHKRGGTPDSGQVWLSIGQPRRCGGCSLRRRRPGGGWQSPVGSLIGRLDRGFNACRNRHYDIHLSRFG